MSEDKEYYPLSLKQIRRILQESRMRDQRVMTRSKVRRQLIIRDDENARENMTGTYLPPPFDKTHLALKSMAGEAAKAAQHYASRIAANDPDISIEPPSPKSEINATLDKNAGDQERMDASLWESNAGKEKQWDIGMCMAVDGVGYYLTLPRDADFGLPDRMYYETDEEAGLLKKAGKLAPMQVPHPKTGKWVYAEHGDVWAARRKEAARAQAGNSLFTLEALPRDMVRVGRDKDGIKWAAVIEEIPGTDCTEGSEIAIRYARKNGVSEDDVALYGIWVDRQGRVIGGVPRGGPEEQGWTSPRSFTLIRFFDRINQCVLIAANGTSVEGATEIWSGEHCCRRLGKPSVPVVEVAMMRTGINVAGQEFTTPMEPVFAYIPIINQLMTILSNAAAFNGIPRWVVEDKDGVIRGEDGEPELIDQGEFVPGLNPSEALSVKGTLKQVLIDTTALENLLTLYREALATCMPGQAATGDEGGSDGPAWGKRLMIQQSQENLRQPISNHATAVKQILQMWHDWMRQLDIPVYFFAVSGYRSDKRNVHGLIEFDPKDLTDMVNVTQSVDTPEEHTVLIQTGLELRQAGAITWREFFEEYLRAQDAREAEIDMYVQMVLDQVMTGVSAPPGSVIATIASGVQGELHYMLIQQSDNYALSQAEQMANQAQMPTGTQPQLGSPQTANVAQPAGVSQPGMGQAPSLQQQLGNNVPGGLTPAQPAGVS